MSKKKQSARITDLKAENYDLRVRNEFLENRIAIAKSKKQDFMEQTKHLTKEERAELLRRIRDFKSSVYSFIEKSRNKEVELVRGEWYFCHHVCFRYYYTEVCTFENKIHVLSLVNTDLSFYGSSYFYKNKGWEIVEATTEQIKQGITLERDNGYFWNDEKQDFLKLEDVCYKAKTRQELLDIAILAGAEVLSNDFDIRISYPFVQMLDNSFICNSLSADKGKIEVIKEVFTKLLKNYKG